MTPGARVQAAIEILAAIESGERPADDSAAAYFRHRRYIGAKDRTQISAHVYAVLRHRAVLDWWITRGSSAVLAPSARPRMLAVLAIVDHWTQDDIATSFDGSKFRPAALKPVEKKLVVALAGRSLTHPEMPRATACDIPEWLEPHLGAVYGRRLADEMAALNTTASLDLRVNALKTDRDTALQALAAEHIKAEPTPWSPLGLRIKHRGPLAGTETFKNGLVEVQDEGSQVAALLADARPGMRVVDFCAGAGGKTLALAAAMKNRGKLVACDTAEWRLERAGVRLRRAGISNVERHPLSSERDQWVKRHAGTFDRVFVDAPCLGIGSWRRNPDGKWRCTPNDLAELIERQRDILASAARLVKPGGRLVYCTCSLLTEENEAQAETFLATHADFSLFPVAWAWTDTIGTTPPTGAEDYLRLTPARHGTDGFFLAQFQRAKSPRPDAPLPAGEEAQDETPEAEQQTPVIPGSEQSADFREHLLGGPKIEDFATERDRDTGRETDL